MTDVLLQGRYRIVRSLGRGGRGAVFLCDDLRLPGKQWAIKQMNSPEAGLEARFREMFEREAATLSGLRHPSLPVVVDSFQERGESFLVMEFVDGENLAQRVRREGPMTEAEAFRVGAVLLDLLAYLHRHDPPIIFRDLKPENVMRSRSGELKLVDFGLARHYVSGQRHDTVQAGSVGYAPPEQWEDLAQTDERSDVYSWAATLVFLLTGRIPNPHLPLTALRAVSRRPSAEGLAILAECLQPLPDDRPEDALHLGRVVRRHIEALGATPPPTPPGHPQGPASGEVRRIAARPRGPLQPPEALGAPGASAVLPAEPTGEGGSPTGSRSGVRSGSTTGSRSGSTTGSRSGSTTGSRSGSTTGSRSGSTAGSRSRRSFPPSASPREHPDDLRPPRPAPPDAPDSGADGGWIARVGPLLALALIATAAVLYLGLGWGRRAPGPGSTPTTSGQAPLGVPPYQRRFTRNPDLEEGRRLYQAGRWAEAAAPLHAATTRFPEDAEAQVLEQNARIRAGGGPFVRLPYIGTFTGDDGPEAYSHLYGMALGQARINQEGGIDGRPVLLDYHDDESSTPRCLEIARQLLLDREVSVVLGPTTSQRTLAVAPLFNSARVDLIAPAASAAPVWSAGPYVFTASDGREPRVKAMALFATRAENARIAVVFEPGSTLSREMADIFTREVIRRGGTCVPVPPCDDPMGDFSAQIDAIRAQAPTAVFVAEYRGAPLARFAVALRGAGVTVPLLSQAVPYARDLVDIGGPAVDGLLTTEYFHPDIDTPTMRAFVEAFHRQFGEVTPPYASANSYDAFNAAVAALKQPRGREGAHAFLRASGVTRPPFQGVGGPYALGRRLDARPVWLIEIRGGRYRLVERLGPPDELRASPGPATGSPGAPAAGPPSGSPGSPAAGPPSGSPGSPAAGPPSGSPGSSPGAPR